MLPLIAKMTDVLLRPLMKGKDGGAGQALGNAIKDRFSADHDFLKRDERHDVTLGRSVAGESEAVVRGTTPRKGEEAGIDWLEYAFPEEKRLDDCTWSGVHWRLYRNGRIAVHMVMDNTSGLVDGGDLQGHRLELRTEDGWLVGAWTAAFFVRRGTAIRAFPATILDDHPLLSVHFDELAERQTGHWFHAR